VVALGTPQQVALRCRIILAVAAGKTEMMIAAENDVNRKTVSLWRERFRRGGPQALWEIAPGRGRKPSYDLTRIKAVIDATLQTKHKGSTHWSCRTMAAAQGISKSSVSRIWRSHNIKPHRTETFKLSHDPRFLEKTHGRDRSLSESSRPADCALCGRDEPNSGSATHPSPGCR
jgi:transposase